MAVQVPTEQQLREVAAEVGLALTDTDVKSFIDRAWPPTTWSMPCPIICRA
jgi:hypothetical protein